MRILRIVFSLLILLCALALAGIGALFQIEEKQRYLSLEQLGEFPLAMLFFAAAVVVLMLAGLVFPRGKPEERSKPKPLPKWKGPPPKSKAPPASSSKSLGADFAEAKRKQQEREKALLASTQEQEKQQQAEDKKQEAADSTYASLDDPEAMARLVVFEQSELTRPVVTSLCQEFFPELVKIIDRIESDDHFSLETFGHHIIGIGRNRLKMTDKSLNDEQFTLFQERLFAAEREPILQCYNPADRTNLSEQQQRSVGMMVDKRGWGSKQRQLNADQDDWHDVSIANAKEFL